MGLPKEHVSVSQINQYLRCPAQYYFKYIQDMKAPSNGAMTFGKAVHKAIEYYFKGKLEYGQEASLSEVQDVFATTINKSDNTEWGEEKPDAVKDEGVKTLELYMKEVAPTIQPKAIEQEIRVPFGDYELLGYIDLIDQNDVIIDTKTTKKTPSAGMLTNGLQLSAYTMAHQFLTGNDPTGVRLDYIVRLKTPKIVQIESKKTSHDVNRFLGIMDRVVRNIKEANFYPNPTCMTCNPKSCSYFEICQREDW
jgi:CRISPR/Cas system-associated exonuclease Cas4 (RecB family)